MTSSSAMRRSAGILSTVHRTHATTYRTFSTSKPRHADFTHAVIGGGAVGLAIARRLQQENGSSTLLLERHKHPGTETSSRNSEVIHAALYYGEDTLKTKLCVSGREQMYAFAKKYDIPHMNCGKFIVAQDGQQLAELEKVHSFASTIGVPTRLMSPDEANAREPEVRCESGALESLSTGIIDSHTYMQVLHGTFEEEGGETAFESAVSKIEPLGNNRDGSGGWRIYVNGNTDPSGAITVETLINSAGLAAIPISNMILPEDRQRKPFYAKGSYYSYSASHPKPKTLIYPAPVPGHGGLGTHLTLDMAGRIRFGPDVEWVEDPTDLSVNDKGFEQALSDIQAYLPGLQRSAVNLDYCGIRPKLARKSAQMKGKDFVDFYIKKEEGFSGFVNLLGIESPGLTSSLAIGDHVRDMLYR